MMKKEKIIAQLLLHIDDKNLLGSLDVAGQVQPADDIDEQLYLLVYDTDEDAADLYYNQWRYRWAMSKYWISGALGINQIDSYLPQSHLIHTFKNNCMRYQRAHSLIAICYQLALSLNEQCAKKVATGETVIQVMISQVPPTTLWIWSHKGKLKTYLTLTSIPSPPEEWEELTNVKHYIKITFTDHDLHYLEESISHLQKHEYMIEPEQLVSACSSTNIHRFKETSDVKRVNRNRFNLLAGFTVASLIAISILTWYLHNQQKSLKWRYEDLQQQLRNLQQQEQNIRNTHPLGVIENYSQHNPLLVLKLVENIADLAQIDNITWSDDQGSRLKYSFVASQETAHNINGKIEEIANQLHTSCEIISELKYEDGELIEDHELFCAKL